MATAMGSGGDAATAMGTAATAAATGAAAVEQTAGTAAGGDCEYSQTALEDENLLRTVKVEDCIFEMGDCHRDISDAWEADAGYQRAFEALKEKLLPGAGSGPPPPNGKAILVAHFRAVSATRPN